MIFVVLESSQGKNSKVIFEDITRNIPLMSIELLQKAAYDCNLSHRSKCLVLVWFQS